MKKKIHPKDQTKEIVEAHYEFMQRNPEQKKRINFTIHIICSLLNLPEDKAKKMIKADLARWHGAARDGHYLLKKSWINAVAKRNEEWPSEKYPPIDPNSRSLTQTEWTMQIIKDASSILTELILSNPNHRRIVVINLERTKEAIMAELEEIVTKALMEYQEILKKPPYTVENIIATVSDSFAKNVPWFHEENNPNSIHFIVTDKLRDDEAKKQERLKWLSIWRDLLEVWDLYEKAGQQPWLKTFRHISRKVGRPLSTVKDQWRQAYEKIYGKKYIPEIKYATEEKRSDADALCVSCPHGAKCYRGGDWFPCRDYQVIAGKEMSVKSVVYDDEINYNNPNPRKSRKNKHE